MVGTLPITSDQINRIFGNRIVCFWIRKTLGLENAGDMSELDFHMEAEDVSH